jgi:hypothetical protein
MGMPAAIAEEGKNLVQERIYKIAEVLDAAVGDALTDVEFSALVDRLAAL